MSRPVGHPDNQAIGRLGNQIRWAKVADRAAETQPARAAFNDRFLREARERFTSVVDPDGDLPPDELERELAYRAEKLRNAHFLRLSLRSAQARRAKKAGGAA